MAFGSHHSVSDVSSALHQPPDCPIGNLVGSTPHIDPPAGNLLRWVFCFYTQLVLIVLIILTPQRLRENIEILALVKSISVLTR